MRRVGFNLLLAVCTIWLMSGVAWAQASGSFSYNDQGATEHCVLGTNGSITGGYICQNNCTTTGTSCTSDADCGPSGSLCDPNTNECVTCTSNSQSGTCGGSFAAGIKGNGGNGNIFVIEPSAVIGLLTDVSVNKITQSSSALAGVDFTVTATDAAGNAVSPTPDFAVTYDSRYIQISSNLFNALTNSCVGTATAGAGCYFSFSESTVSAHSFQWLLPEDGTSGTYTVTASWSPSLGNSGISQALTCVGPVNFTIQQNKVYHFNKVNAGMTTVTK